MVFSAAKEFVNVGRKRKQRVANRNFETHENSNRTEGDLKRVIGPQLRPRSRPTGPESAEIFPLGVFFFTNNLYSIKPFFFFFFPITLGPVEQRETYTRRRCWSRGGWFSAVKTRSVVENEKRVRAVIVVVITVFLSLSRARTRSVILRRGVSAREQRD